MADDLKNRGEPDRSRGLLCLDALRMNGARHALTWLADEVLTCRYAPFSLFVALKALADETVAPDVRRMKQAA